MKKTVSILLILSTLVLTLAACSGESTDTGSGKSKDTAESTSESSAESAESAEPTIPTVPKKTDPLDLLADTDPVYGEMYVYDDYSPYIRLNGNLVSIQIKRADADKLVEEFMAGLLSAYQGIDFVDAPEDASVAMRDRATVYYTGYSADPDFTIDEDTLASMTNKDDEEGYPLVIGSNSFIAAYESEEHPENNNPGFEEQLVGAKAGETRTITVTFPDGYLYAPELGGRPIKFDVTIVSIENPDPDEPTEVTDEMVSDYTYGEYTTVEDLLAFKLEDCMTQLAYEAVYNMITVIGYPEAEYNELFESYMDYYTYDDITEEELAALRESGDKAVKEVMEEELIYNFLYAHFDIKLTKAEYLEKRQELYDESAMMLAFYYGINSAEQMEEYYTRDYLISYFKSELLSEILTEKAVWADEAPETTSPESAGSTAGSTEE